MLEQNMDMMIQYYDFELQLVRLSVVEKTLPVKIGLLVTNSQIEVTLDEMINSSLLSPISWIFYVAIVTSGNLTLWSSISTKSK